MFFCLAKQVREVCVELSVVQIKELLTENGEKIPQDEHKRSPKALLVDALVSLVKERHSEPSQ